MPRARVWPASSAFVVFGIASVIAGGLISALFASNPDEQAAWLVAYLVLVVGVAQVGLGAGQAWLANREPRRSMVAVEFIAYNLGNAGVIVGTLVQQPFIVDIGGVALVVALVLLLWNVRGRGAGGWLRYLYWLLIAILAVSIPVGLVLSFLRHG